jgi:hypothetical protein
MMLGEKNRDLDRASISIAARRYKSRPPVVRWCR